MTRTDFKPGWWAAGGEHPLSREQGGCLDKAYFERGFIHMTGGKWLENKKWSVVLMQKDQQRWERANWGPEELNSLSAPGIHKWGLTLAYTYRNSLAGRSPESHGFCVLFAQKSSTSASGDWQDRWPHPHPRWLSGFLLPGAERMEAFCNHAWDPGGLHSHHFPLSGNMLSWVSI